MNERLSVIFCDFDGTLTVEDIGLALMERFAPPQWIEWEKRWRRGEISTRENMEAQLNLIEASSAELIEWLKGCPLRAGALEFIDACRQRGVAFHLVSDGLDFYIDPIRNAHGLGALPYHANQAERDAAGRWHIRTPNANPDCRLHGCCKCLLIERLDPGHAARRIYIGDAYTDLCPSRHADLVFARDVLAEHCREAGRPFIEFETFADVADALWPGMSAP